MSETTPRALLAESARALSSDEARRDGELLLMHALGVDRAWLYAHGDDSIEATKVARFRQLSRRRASGEPLAYLIGRREFWSLDLQVTPDVLIPRPETELLVELALQRIPLRAAMEVADLGTGSGAIALALARERPLATLLATDASAAALAVARHNAQRLNIGNITFAHGDWCAALREDKFDLIVSNPPYIAASDPHLNQGDLRYEPQSALASGAQGLDAIRAIIAAARANLRPDASLLLEHGYDQGVVVRGLFEQSGFTEIFTACDLEGRERVSGAVSVSPLP